MLDFITRPLKDKILTPLGKVLARFINPNGMSFLAFLVALGSVTSVYFSSYITALVLWLLSRIMDGLDGVIARSTNKQSDFGGYLDIMLDFIIYSLLPLVFAISRSTMEIWIVTTILLAIFYVNAASWMYLSAILEKRNTAKRQQTSVVMPSALIGGTESIIWYCLWMIFPDQYVLFAIIFSSLTFLGIIQRFIWAARNLK